LSDALKMVAKTMVDGVYDAALKPVQNALGGFVAQGLNGLMSGVMPFAKGGVVSGATHFPMKGGAGVMGEAGPEAIMPLARGADGRLGIMGGGGAVTVVMNITTPDVAGFQRSQAQIAAQAGRALARGQRNR
jgi:lambda family phage tail tape measure protein